MAVTSGFFNAVSGDRAYDAVQMSQLFEGIIRDGVFATVGQAFAVNVVSGNNLSVGTGRAWFNNTWTNNDASVTVAATAAHGSLPRIDALVLEVNWGQSVRANSFKVIAGTAATTPVRPVMGTGTTMRQYPIAYIHRVPGAASIAQQYITYNVGQANCPFVAGPLANITIASWTDAMSDKFLAWFNALGDYLTPNAEAVIAADLVSLWNKVGLIDNVNASQSLAIQQRVDAESTLRTGLNAANTARASGDAALSRRVESLEVGGAGLEIRMRTPRGNNLGAQITASQLSAIRSGAFTNMWLGDYWLANTIRYRIVDFNYIFSMGNGHTYNLATKPHLVLMPDTMPINSRFHATGTITSTGYNESPARADVGISIANRVMADLKVGVTVVPLTGEYVTNGIVSGVQSTVLANSRAHIPTHLQIYGVTPCADDLNTYGNAQFALMREDRRHIRPTASDYWLRSIQGPTSYWYVNSNGFHNARGANVLTRVRPYFYVA